MGERIAKFMANAGICSRREAEKLVNSGRVKVDGKVIATPAFNVEAVNIVELDNNIIVNKPVPRLWIYHKPAGLITTHKDPQLRPTIFSSLKGLPRVISIGRLDINSEGLLLLTNNGDLAKQMMHPSNNYERVYKVRAYGRVQSEPPQLELPIENQLITIDNITYYVKSLRLISKGGSNRWYKVVLTEGKNREIRKIFTHFKLEVNRLIRVSYGAYQLGDLKPGQYQEVEIKELKIKNRNKIIYEDYCR